MKHSELLPDFIKHIQNAIFQPNIFSIQQRFTLIFTRPYVNFSKYFTNNLHLNYILK